MTTNWTHRELTELAALAAGIEGKWDEGMGCLVCEDTTRWRPIYNDGDVFRLSLQLKIEVECSIENRYSTAFNVDNIVEQEQHDSYVGSYLAATRLAVVKVAARMGDRIRKANLE